VVPGTRASRCAAATGDAARSYPHAGHKTALIFRATRSVHQHDQKDCVPPLDDITRCALDAAWGSSAYGDDRQPSDWCISASASGACRLPFLTSRPRRCIRARRSCCSSGRARAATRHRCCSNSTRKNSSCGPADTTTHGRHGRLGRLGSHLMRAAMRSDFKAPVGSVSGRLGTSTAAGSQFVADVGSPIRARTVSRAC